MKEEEQSLWDAFWEWLFGAPATAAGAALKSGGGGELVGVLLDSPETARNVLDLAQSLNTEQREFNTNGAIGWPKSRRSSNTGER